MDNSLKDQAVAKIQEAQSILVVVDKSSNLDGLASGLALYLSLKKQGKIVSILAKAPTVSDARLLYGVGDIGKPGRSKNLVISVNNAVENVDKVTYFLDNSLLKIVIHALPDSQGVKTEDLAFGTDIQTPDTILAVGFNDDFMNTDIIREQKIDPNAFTISVNVNKPTKKFAQIDVIDPNSPSISQITASLLQALSLPIDEDIAFNLYTGIASATQMFSPSFAKPETLSTSAWLLKVGAGSASLAQRRVPISNLTVATETEQTQASQASSEQIPPKNDAPPIEIVEREKAGEEDWLKPPKIYRGSKSFDIES